MSEFRSALLRSIAATFVAFGLAGPLVAQGNASATKADSSSSDGIAEAKKDFEGIKATRDAALVPGAQGPRMSVPELSLPTQVVPPSATKAKTPASQKKASNWLIDAMEKQNANRGSKAQDTRGTVRSSRDDTRELEFERADQESVERNENNLADERRARAEQTERSKETAAAVVNPLNSFLGDWMTPRDYALLKPGLTSSGDANLAGQTSTFSMPSDGTGVPKDIADLSLKNAMPSPALNVPPRENPYLQLLKPETTAAPSVAGVLKPTTPVAVLTVPAPSAVTAPTPVQPSAKVPDFARPANDDRYFKQLKRF